MKKNGELNHTLSMEFGESPIAMVRVTVRKLKRSRPVHMITIPLTLVHALTRHLHIGRAVTVRETIAPIALIVQGLCTVIIIVIGVVVVMIVEFLVDNGSVFAMGDGQ